MSWKMKIKIINQWRRFVKAQNYNYNYSTLPQIGGDAVAFISEAIIWLLAFGILVLSAEISANNIN